MVELVFTSGIKLGRLLNCAIYNTNDLTFLKYLWTYDAQVNNTGVDSNIALIYAFQTDNIRFAILLLDNNVDLNAINMN